jgi:transposase
MRNSKLLCKLLQLKEMKVTWFQFADYGKELRLGVKPFKNGCRCPECDRRGRVARTAGEARQWRDVTILGIRIVLLYAPREIVCLTHGSIQEAIPWAAVQSRVSYRLEFRICALGQIMTQKAAAAILGMASSTLSDLLHRLITRTRIGHRIRGLITMGVDEISYLKRHKFATIVYDLDRSRVLWVGQGKGRATIDRFFNEQLSPAQIQRIRWASCDMSRAYTEAIKHHCPNATLVIDRFHLVKSLNQAVDEVRKEAWRALKGDARHAIKGLRWLLGMHSRNRTCDQTGLLQKLRNSNRRIHRAWVLKDEFEHFWNYTDVDSARSFLKRWMTLARKTRIPSMRTFAATLHLHQDNIVSFIQRPLTNAVGEGLNRVIKIVKNRASGYRNLEAFTDLIYLTVGDFDILAHIPSRLRSL